MLEIAKTEKEGVIKMCQIEAIKAAVATPPVMQVAHSDKRYIHKLPLNHESESLYAFLGRFKDRMRSAEIPEIQWISRMRDTVTGKVLRTFKDL